MKLRIPAFRYLLKLMLLQGELVLIQGVGANQELTPGDLGISEETQELLIDKTLKSYSLNPRSTFLFFFPKIK